MNLKFIFSISIFSSILCSMEISDILNKPGENVLSMDNITLESYTPDSYTTDIDKKPNNKETKKRSLNGEGAIQTIHKKTCIELPSSVKEKKVCKHKIKALKVLDENSIEVTTENDDIKKYYTRSYLTKLFKNFSYNKNALISYDKNHISTIMIKKPKNRACNCYQTLKDFNKTSKNKIVNNKRICFIAEEDPAIKDLFKNINKAQDK